MPPVFGWFTGASTRWWGRPLLVPVTVMATIAALTLAMIMHSPSAKAGGTTTPTADVAATKAPGKAPATAPAEAPSTAAPKAAAPRTTAPSPALPPSPRDAVAHAVRAIDPAGRLSVAVADAHGGGPVSYDSGGSAYDTASIVKVDILAALLLRDQRAGTGLTARQRTLATDMIEKSDNDAADELWGDIGAGPGLSAANRTLGLRRTTPGDGYLWGLTQTTARDQIALLRAVLGGGSSPLSSSSRAYLSGLMTSISDGQRWGVSAADSDDAHVALKNGWLQRSTTELWDVNSIGEVTHDGHRLLVSVLSSGQRSERKGIDQLGRVARAAAEAYVGAVWSGPAGSKG